MEHTEISPNIGVADQKAVARPLAPPQYDTIVSVGYDDKPPTTSSTGDEFWFPDGDHDYSVFKSAVDYVIKQINTENSVLVHCRSGRSRSTAIVITTLAITENLSLDEAFNRVKNKHPLTDPATPIRDSMERYTDDTIDDYRKYL